MMVSHWLSLSMSRAISKNRRFMSEYCVNQSRAAGARSLARVVFSFAAADAFLFPPVRNAISPRSDPGPLSPTTIRPQG
jgi:hypothetical protein